MLLGVAFWRKSIYHGICSIFVNYTSYCCVTGLYYILPGEVRVPDDIYLSQCMWYFWDVHDSGWDKIVDVPVYVLSGSWCMRKNEKDDKGQGSVENMMKYGVNKRKYGIIERKMRDIGVGVLTNSLRKFFQYLEKWKISPPQGNLLFFENV